MEADVGRPGPLGGFGSHRSGPGQDPVDRGPGQSHAVVVLEVPADGLRAGVQAGLDQLLAQPDRAFARHSQWEDWPSAGPHDDPCPGNTPRNLAERRLMTSRSTPLRVLVADDAEDIQDVLVLMVKRCGHLAHRARDGVEAIEALVEHTYDLVILDLMMPRMTGEDVIRWLQQHPERGPDTRVIIVTGSAEQHRARLEALGAHAVVSKPLGLQQLRELLSREEAQRVVAD